MRQSRIARFLGPVLSLGLLIGWANQASAQISITVPSFGTFEITVLIGSFNQVQSLPGIDLTTTAQAPWYSGSALDQTAAVAFRNAWFAAATTSSIPNNSTLLFANNSNGSTVSYASVTNSGGMLSAGVGGLGATSTTQFGRTVLYASVVEVPEINGSALAQMLLVLGVLGTCLAARRMRQAQV